MNGGLRAVTSASIFALVGLGAAVTGCGHSRPDDVCTAGMAPTRRGCACPTDTSWDGHACAPLAVVHEDAGSSNGTLAAAGGATLASTEPLTPGSFTCPGGSVAQGNGCVCPNGGVWVNEGCQTCPGGSVAKGDGCVCPNGGTWVNDACQVCPGGSVPQGEGCVCPGGTAWTNERCEAVPVAVAQAKPARARNPWIPRPPAPPEAPQVPNISINVPVTSITNNVTVPSGSSQSAPSRGSSVGSGGGGGGGRGSSPPPNVSYAACTGGMQRVGTACQCPRGTEWNGGQCVVTCHPTQVRSGNQCTCPTNTRWNGQRCELWQECRAGEVRIGASCVPGSNGGARRR